MLSFSDKKINLPRREISKKRKKFKISPRGYNKK